MGIHGFISSISAIADRLRELTKVEAYTEEDQRQVNLNKALLRKFESIFTANARNIGSYDYLFIDANTLCYSAIDPVYSRGDFANEDNTKKLDLESRENTHKRCYALIWEFYLELISTIKAKKVFISFDGPVCLAKLKQQKGRRYESALKLDASSTFDTAAISPGTSWMVGLDSFLRKKIQEYSEEENSDKCEELTYSSFAVPGEGEHKIMDVMSNLEEKNIALYGQDSDLVLLCMSQLLKKNNEIDLVTTFTSNTLRRLYEKHNIPEKKRKNLVYKSRACLNVNAFTTALRSYLGERPNSIADFIFCMSVLGNDFVPRPLMMLQARTGVKLILDALIELFPRQYEMSEGYSVFKAYSSRDYIFKNEVVSWQNFAGFLQILCGEKGEKEYEAISQTEATTLPQVIEVGLENGEWTRRSGKTIRKEWYRIALGDDHEDTDISEMSVEFLKGISWVSKYYFGGQDSTTWNWCYPFDYAPFMFDLLQELLILLEQRVLFEVLSLPEIGEKVTVAQQLVAIIHPLSLQWVPEELRVLWSTQSRIRDMIPQGFIIDKDGLTSNKLKDQVFKYKDLELEYGETVVSSSDWTGVKVLPYIELGRIEEELNRLVKHTKWSSNETEDVVFKTKQAKVIESRQGFGRGRGGDRGSFNRGRGRGGNRGSFGRGRGVERGRGRGKSWL